MAGMEELDHIRSLTNRMREEALRIAETRSGAFPCAIRYDTIGGSHGTPENTMEDSIIRALMQGRKLRLIETRRKEEIKEALKIIQASDMNICQRHIIYLRYFAHTDEWETFSWPDVFRFVNLYHNIERRRMFALHREAIAIYKNNKKSAHNNV